MSMEVTNSSTVSAPDNERQRLISNLPVILGIIGGIVVMGLLIWLTIWLASEYAPQIEAVRDIFIIGFSLAMCLSVIVLVIMLVMLIRLINMLEFEIKPILEKTNETMGTLKGTTDFVSQNVVKPTITASSYLYGITRGVKVLFGNPRKNLPD